MGECLFLFDVAVSVPPGGRSSSLSVSVGPGSASVSSPDLSETLSLRLPSQELSRLSHAELLHLQDKQQPV